MARAQAAASRGRPKKKECPVDWTPLVPRKIPVFGPDVEVDSCPKCNGLYLDKGEIRRLTGNRDLNKLLTKRLGLDADSPYVCPRCGGLMDAEQAGRTRVDVCLGCKGVWVDHGELEALRADKATDYTATSPEKAAELQRADAARARDRKSFWRSVLGLKPK